MHWLIKWDELGFCVFLLTQWLRHQRLKLRAGVFPLSVGEMKTHDRMQTGTQVCVRCYEPEQMRGKTFTLAVMCVWNRIACCRAHFVILRRPTGRCSLLYSALKQLFSVTLAEEVNTLVLFSANIHPKLTSKYSTK